MTLRLLPLLPRIRRWLRRTIRERADEARPVSAIGLERLSAYFPRELIDEARIIVVDEVPVPPLRSWGLDELAAFETALASAITYGEVIFVHRGEESSESLIFHELIHVVQWRRLGMNVFLLMYAIRLLQDGYTGSPLEEIAYDLQRRFDTSGRPFDACREAEAHAVKLRRALRARSRALWWLIPALRALPGQRLVAPTAER